MNFFHFLFMSVIFKVYSSFAQFDDDNCQWKENITEITDLMNHHFVVLEKCLYYHLSSKANEKENRMDTTDAVVAIPPINKAGESVEVSVSDTVLQRLWMNEYYRDMHLDGLILVEWKDPRFRWDNKIWHMNELRIESMYHIWVPSLESERATKQEEKFYGYFKHITASKNGVIKAQLTFSTSTLCDVDFYNYPNDMNHCCLELQSVVYPELLKFKINNNKGRTDKDVFQSVWLVTDIHTSKSGSEGDPKSGLPPQASLKICISAERSSKTLKLELTLPVVMSAVLIVVAPLFGSFRNQHFVKLFTILLQYLCFEYLVEKTPHLGFGRTVPKIYRFYEFSIAVSLVSLLMTLIMDALSRMERTLPPPHNLLLAASAINSKLCCGEQQTNQAPPGSSQNPDSSQPTSTKNDWTEIFIAFNNIMSVIIMVVYLLGIAILCT